MPGFRRDIAYLAKVPCGCKIYYTFSFDNDKSYEITYCDRHSAPGPMNTTRRHVHELAKTIELVLVEEMKPMAMTIDDLLTTLRNPAGKSEDELKDAMFQAANMLEDYKRGVDAMIAIVDKEKE